MAPEVFYSVSDDNRQLKGERMKKPIVMLLCFALISAISVAMIKPAGAEFTFGQWLAPYADIDGSRVAYRHGATASAMVGYVNDVSPTILMNVSKIVFEFYSLGINKTLDLSASPVQLQHDQVGTFTLSFTADVAEFPPGSSWDFDLIIEWVNATSGPMKIVGYELWQREWLGMERFEVFPAAQVDALDSLQKYEAYEDYYWWYSWESIAAQEKATLAVVEKGLGDTYYDRGDYASALAKYNLANTLWEEAIAAEEVWRTKMETADLNISLTEASANAKMADAAVIEANAALLEANATKLQAEAAWTNANGWLFIGMGFALGFSLMGVGTVIYALRKPKAPT